MAELFYPLLRIIQSQAFTGPSTHPGIDYSASVGTDVFAAADGVVSASYLSSGHMTKAEGPPWSYGERIIIKHGDGSETTYNHLSRRIASQGDYVVAGQKIGESGNTGYSFGPHLHFEYREASDAPYSNPEPHLSLGPPPSLSSEIESDPATSTTNKGVILLGAIILAGVGIGLLLIHKGA